MREEEAEINDTEWETALRVLQAVSENTDLIQENERFKALVAKIHRLGKKGERTMGREQIRADDAALRSATLQRNPQPTGTPEAPLLPAASEFIGTLKRPISCYICKALYTQTHFFYHKLCPTCAAQNYAKRHQRADLSGRTALVTGGRIKIGYQTVLRLLRDGARVLATTRFATDAAQRFAREPDYSEWQERLQLYALDLRHLPSVEAFADHLLQTEPALDILINNAAQTVKRPLAFYQHLLTGQGETGDNLPVPIRSFLAGAAEGGTALLEAHAAYPAAQTDLSRYFPEGAYDADGQQIDKRPENSWVLRLGEVATIEMVEVHLVNAVAPFILNGRLKPLLIRSPFPRRFIVNVSAMEGQFTRETKTADHPHTNMAKAALNMMTRTTAQDYAESGIYMTSVDTGWITDENPLEQAEWVRDHRGFHPPLDQQDGMARIYDPIAQGINQEAMPFYGVFLKDYAPYPW